MKAGAWLVSFVVVSATMAGISGQTKPAAGDSPWKMADEFLAGFNAKDVARVVATYADDAIYMPPNQPMVKGRANIEAHYRKALADKSLGKIRLAPIERTISGMHAFDAGAYSLDITPPSGKPMTVTGKYLVILKKTPAGWRVAYDIDNPDAAPQGTM